MTIMDETTIENSIENEENAETPAPELREARWSVISFDKCEAKNLIYAEAEKKLEELFAQNVSGLCIVTDEAAAKIR